MDTKVLQDAGATELQAKIYLYLVKNGQSTPTEIANGINEKRTTIYSAIERLIKLEIVSQSNKGKKSAFVANHPSKLEVLAERRLRSVARQAKMLESNLPSLINYYNKYQNEPGAMTFFGQEGVDLIREKALASGDTFLFIRSRYDNLANKEKLEEFKQARVQAGIRSENITPSEYVSNSTLEAKKWGLERTYLPPSEYDSPVEIDIFGDNVAFVNYAKNGMSTLIESPEIADAMRQFFKFAKKYIIKATDQNRLSPEG